MQSIGRSSALCLMHRGAARFDAATLYHSLQWAQVKLAVHLGNPEAGAPRRAADPRCLSDAI
jgi:hypothetical protein